MKKAISVLLILTTLLGCCALFFSCKKDKEETEGVQKLENKSEVVIDIASSGLAAGAPRGAEPTGLWNIKSGTQNAQSRILNLNFSKSVADFKEVTFWMFSNSAEAVPFVFYFIGADGTAYRAQTHVDNPWVERKSTGLSTTVGNTVDMTPVADLKAQYGWHQYTIPLDEVEPLDKSKRTDYAYNAETDTINVKFDKSSLVGIRIDLSNSAANYDFDLHIGSVMANTNKYGTMKGFGIKKISNAVCFYKGSNFYLYNQLRYCLVDDENASVGINNDSVYVPIAVLAEHRGAQITANTKDAVSFVYNGATYTYTAGAQFTYVANERGYNAGRTMVGTTSSVGNYLTIPMEVAARDLGYCLFYDTTGLAIFSDRPNPTETTNWTGWADDNDEDHVMFVSPKDPNYYEDLTTDSIPGRQFGYIAQITKVINFDYYTGQDMLADMDKIHGKETHGNLVVSNEQIEKLKELIETDPVYKSWFSAFESKYVVGTEAYNEKLPTWGTSDGYRLSTGNSERIKAYGFLYRVTGDEDYAEKVVQTMQALLKYKDPVSGQLTWNTGEYLSCAEIIFDYTLGYDWCYDYIAKDEETLKQLEDGAWSNVFGAIIGGHGGQYEWWLDLNNVDTYNQKNNSDDDPNTVNSPWGFCTIPYLAFDHSKQGLKRPNAQLLEKRSWDACQFNGNWNAVCDNAVISAAFAFANINNEFRAASEYILTLAVNDTTYGMVDCYSPDGGHPEGTGYWYFGTKDQMPMLTTIKNCTGSYHGLNDFAGYEDSFDYVIGLGSTTYSWSYHDADEIQKNPTAQFIMAGYMFDSPALSQFRYNELLRSGAGKVGVWDLMFYNPETCYENTSLDLDLDYISYKIGMVTFRSDWTESQMFCGLHGGANNAGHGQQDIGTFILEYNGVRFFTDLGKDSYIMPGYFSYPQRNYCYVNRAEGHNTLVINPYVVSKLTYKWDNFQYVDVYKSDYYERRKGNGQGTSDVWNYDQSYSAVGDIIDYASTPSTAYGVVNMGSAYGFYDSSKVKQGVIDFKAMTNIDAKRGILVTDDRSTVIIQDEMDLAAFGNDTNEVLWMGHIVEGGSITISKDKQAALVSFNGSTLMCEIVTPDWYTGTWKFESRAADYLRETKLTLKANEFSRDGKQKLVAISTVVSQKEGDNIVACPMRIAVVCRLLSSGPHNYSWVDINNWSSLL